MLNQIPTSSVIKNSTTGSDVGNAIRQNMIILANNSNRLLSKKTTFNIDVSNRLLINFSDVRPKLTDLVTDLNRIADDMTVRSEEVNSSAGFRMAQKLKTGVNKWLNDLRFELNELKTKAKQQDQVAPIPMQPLTPNGEGIAKYRHMRGGSINTFLDKIHKIIHIKKIQKFNKSTYVINV